MDQIGDYKMENIIGAGAFARVYRARHKKTNQIYAIKLVDLYRLTENNSKLKDNLNFEIKILQLSGSHPNIVSLYEVIEAPPPNQDSYLYMVMECCESDFSKYIQKNGKMTEEKALHFMRQLADGLKFLRSFNIIHRDLKPQNLLLKEQESEFPILKIADFGFAKFIDVQSLSDTFCGSPLYMAPEILHRKNYTVKADLWSVGVILYEMLVGKPPFNSSTVIDLLRQLEKSIQLPSYINVSRECKDLLYSLLQSDENNRISWEDFFKHPWFGGRDLNNSLYSNSNPTTISNYDNLSSSSFYNISNNPMKTSSSNNNNLQPPLNIYSTSPPILEYKMPFQHNNIISSSPNSNPLINNTNNNNTTAGNNNNKNNIQPFKENIKLNQAQTITAQNISLDFERDCVILDDEIYSLDKVLNIARVIAELGDLRQFEPTECLLLYVKALNLMKVKIQQQSNNNSPLTDTFKSTFGVYTKKAIQIFSSNDYQQKIDYINHQQQLQQNTSTSNNNNNSTPNNNNNNSQTNQQLQGTGSTSSINIQNQTTSSSLLLPLFSPNKFIYDSALDFGKKGAVEEVLKNYSKSNQCYNDGLLLLEYLLSISLDKDDREILKKFINSFSDRISNVNRIISTA